MSNILQLKKTEKCRNKLYLSPILLGCTLFKVLSDHQVLGVAMIPVTHLSNTVAVQPLLLSLCQKLVLQELQRKELSD